MAASDHLVVTVEAEVHPPGSEIPVKKRAGTVEQEVELKEVVTLTNEDHAKSVNVDELTERDKKGEAVHVPGHKSEVQYADKARVIIPSEKIPGFEGYKESDLPFYSMAVSIERYGQWKLDQHLQQKRSDRDPKVKPRNRACILIPYIVSQLHWVKCKSMSECLDAAEVIIQKDPNSGLDNLVAPNGKQLERRDRIALFLAEKVLAAVGNTDDAIPVYISDAKFGHNQFISMAVLGGLLYMGCSPSLIDVSLYDCAHLAYLLNWGADPNESDSAEDTPLHIAVRDGETKVAEMLLEHGASTSRVNDVNQTALDTAAAFLRFECLKCIYRHIECQRQMGSAREEPNLHKPASLELAKLLPETEEHDAEYDVDVDPLLLKRIFDSCTVDGQKVRTKALVRKTKDIPLLNYLSEHPKMFFRLGNHPVLKALVEAKWNQLAHAFLWSRLFFYLFKMVILTFALAIAARPDLTDDQLNTYPEPLDYFRGICEALVLLVTVAKIVEEILEIVKSKWSYFGDKMNYIEWLYILFALFIIPFRVLNHPGQWIVASLAYFLHGLKIFDFITLFKLTGAYVETLRIILSRDILRFMTVFLVILGIFSGAFYLSLRYDDTLVTLPGSNTTSPGGGVNSDLRNLDGEGRLLHEVYFTGVRALIEASSVLNYYGASGSLRALSVIFYLVFLFLVVIVLLNVLIAQVSDTYSKVLSTAEGVYLYRRFRYAINLDKQIEGANSRTDSAMRHCGPRIILYCLPCVCLLFLDLLIVAPLLIFLYVVMSCKQSVYFLDLPEEIWIGKKPNQGKSKWNFFKRKVGQLFSEYAFDEANDVTAEEVTLKLERKLEHEHSKLAGKMDADRAHLVEETKKLEQKLEEVKSLLCEVTKHIPPQQGAPAALDQVPSDVQDEQPSQQ